MRADTDHNSSVGTPESEYTLSLRHLFGVLRRRFWVIALTVVTLVGVAVGISISQTPRYDASAVVLVGQERGSEVPGNLGGDVEGLQQLTRTVAEAANSRLIADAVIERFDLNVSRRQFFERFSAAEVPETQFVEIRYRDPDPGRAKEVANAAARDLSRRISEVGPSADAVTVTVWDPATVPVDPATPDPVRNGLFALAAALMLGVGLAFLLEYLDDSWSSPEEAERLSGVPTFGVIPQFVGVPRSQRKALSPEDRERTPIGKIPAGRTVELSKADYRQIARDGGRVVWPFGMVLVDTEGRVEESNSVLQEMLGYGAEEIRGAVFAEFAAHPDEVRAHAELYEELFSGKRDHYRGEKRYVRKDGQPIWTWMTVSVVRGSEGEPSFAVGVVEDVTERKRIEEKLRLAREAQRLSETRLRALVEQSSPLIVRSYAPDGSPLMANSAWDGFWNGGEGEAAGAPNLYEDDRLRAAGLIPHVEESVAEGSPVATPPLLYQPARNGHRGDSRWLKAFIYPVQDQDGRVREVMLVIEDITEHKRVEEVSQESVAKREQLEEALRESFAERERLGEALRNSEERFRSLIQYATDISTTVTKSKGENLNGPS